MKTKIELAIYLGILDKHYQIEKQKWFKCKTDS